MNRQIDRQIQVKMNRLVEGRMNRLMLINRRTNGPMDRWIDRQTGIQTDRETSKQTDVLKDGKRTDGWLDGRTDRQ